jgi:hypothetical protein
MVSRRGFGDGMVLAAAAWNLHGEDGRRVWMKILDKGKTSSVRYPTHHKMGRALGI